jgi:hypothetical protein
LYTRTNLKIDFGFFEMITWCLLILLNSLTFKENKNKLMIV